MSPKRSGIALVLMSGLLVLLSLSAAAMVSLGIRLRGRAGSGVDAAVARLLAGSGLEYAAARLSDDAAVPEIPTPANQPDDWTYRDGSGVRLEASRNPSFAQSETYRDFSGNGRYDAGSDQYDDWNGNRRFDAWSGRLRGRNGLASTTFSLRISGDSAEGGICVNAGYLGDTDINGATLDGRAVRDYQDLGNPHLPGVQPDPSLIGRNRRLASVINQLGLILGVAAARPGDLVIRNRPLGGYQSVEKLSGLFSPSDWERLRPHLSVTGRRNTAAAHLVNGSNLLTGSYVPDDRYLLNLELAAPEAVAAVFSGMGEPRNGPVSAWFAWYAADVITPPEALAAARFLKQGRFESRYDLYRRLLAAADALFTPVTDPRAAGRTPRAIQQNKAAWAFALLTPEELGQYGMSPFNGSTFQDWRTYGLGPQSPLPAWLAVPEGADGKQGMPMPGGYEQIRRIKGYSANFDLDASASTELGLMPPTLREVESLGRVSGPSGPVRAASRIRGLLDGGLIQAQTQRDFENFTFAPISRAERTRHPFPGGFIRGRPDRDRTAGYPCFSRDACPDLRSNLRLDPTGEDAEGNPYFFMAPDPSAMLGSDTPVYDPRADFNFCRFYGEVMLADVCGPDGSEVFYLPNWDLDAPERPAADPASLKAGDNFNDAAHGASWSGWLDPLDALLATGTALRDDNFLQMNGIPATIPNNGAILMPSGDSMALNYWWNGNSDPAGAYNPGPFPRMRPGGVIDAGTDSAWCSARSYFQWNAGKTGLSYLVAGFHYRWWRQQRNGSDRNTWQNPAVPGDAPHHVVFVYGGGRMTPYVDGIPSAPALYDTIAVEEGQIHALFSYNQDEFRMHAEALDDARIRATALKGRYRTPDPLADPPLPAKRDLRTVPCFTSALHVFPQPVRVGSVAWDGFVPAPLAEAAESAGGNPPLRVELLLYPGPHGQGGPVAVPVRPDSWKTGGCREGFDEAWRRSFPDRSPMKAGSLRWRVRMDASALDRAWKTPIFDAIAIGLRATRYVGLQEF